MTVQGQLSDADIYAALRQQSRGSLTPSSDQRISGVYDSLTIPRDTSGVHLDDVVVLNGAVIDGFCVTGRLFVGPTGSAPKAGPNTVQVIKSRSWLLLAGEINLHP